MSLWNGKFCVHEETLARGNWPADKDCPYDREDEVAALQSRLSTAEAKVTDLEKDLKLNASMLAKQCDLARDAEAKIAQEQKDFAAVVDDMAKRVGDAKAKVEMAREALKKMWECPTAPKSILEAIQQALASLSE